MEHIFPGGVPDRLLISGMDADGEPVILSAEAFLCCQVVNYYYEVRDGQRKFHPALDQIHGEFQALRRSVPARVLGADDADFQVGRQRRSFGQNFNFGVAWG